MRLAFLLLAASIPAVPQTVPRPAPPGRLVDVGGYRVHLYCTGAGSHAGRPTVMVVGAGFSVDWSLVQSGVSAFTTICTYDVSGTAWSDPGPVLTCRERVNEVHKLIRAAHIETPLVLAGLSIGGCVARLYAAEYPSDVAAVAIVDHAFAPDPPPEAAPHQTPNAQYDSPPVLIEQTPILVTTEDSSDFRRLPARMQQLHRWAASLNPKLPTWEDAEDCLAQLKLAAPGPYALGNLPLAIVSTGNQARGYDRLQQQLLALSHRSIQLLADRSFHSVEIDQPEIVTAAVRWAVDAARGASAK